MARLPVPGSDSNSWGAILNDYLLQSHQANGSLKDDSVGAAAIQEDIITEAHLAADVTTKLDTIDDKVALSDLDTETATRINSTGTAIQNAVLAVATARTTSPRDTQRVKQERKPTLAIDQIFPNVYVDHKIVWIHGDTTLYAVGKDDSLRTSSDSGATWSTRLSNPGGLGQWAKAGLFLRLANGYILTTYHPYDLSAPKIQRSIDGGVNWADVVAAQTNILYLGPTSMCQDPVTGYVYLAEYVTVSAATAATWKISRSTDNGGTWITFHTFQRDATAYPTTAVRHGHAIQWDPVSQRIYFLCGDSEQAAGIYRVNAGGTDVEPIVIRAQLPTDIWAGAVGVMFFPNYIAWGIDQSSDSWLVRMNRNQIGASSPVVEKIMRLQSTAFYTIRTKSDNSEWIMSVSNENGGGGRLDNACHLYRVADDAATCDEISSEAVNNGTSFFWVHPLGDPLKTTTNELFWLSSTVKAIADKSVGIAGWQASARLVWGTGTALLKPDVFTKPYYQEVTVSSGNQPLNASEIKIFGVTEAPLRTTRLYILEVTREQISGTGFAYVEVYDHTGSVILKMEDGTTDMQWQNRSRRSALNENTAPYLCRSATLSPGRQVRFRVHEGLGGASTSEVVATVTYAWGF